MIQKQNVNINAGGSVNTGDFVQNARVHLKVPERRIEEYFIGLRSELKSTGEARHASDQQVELLNERVAELESLLGDKAGVTKDRLQTVARGIRENCGWAWPIVTSVLQKILPRAVSWL